MNKNVGIVERESYTLEEKNNNVEVVSYAIQDHRAITLVALIVTIVVMLILAGVTLSIVFGENGIFSQSKIAAQKYQNARLKEEQELQNISNEISSLGVASNRDGNGQITDEQLTALLQQIEGVKQKNAELTRNYYSNAGKNYGIRRKKFIK